MLVYLKNMQEGLGGQLGRICFRDERMLPVILHKAFDADMRGHL